MHPFTDEKKLRVAMGEANLVQFLLSTTLEYVHEDDCIWNETDKSDCISCLANKADLTLYYVGMGHDFQIF